MMHMSECVFYMHSSLWLSRVNCLTETQLNIKWDVSAWYSGRNYCPLKNLERHYHRDGSKHLVQFFFLRGFHIAHIFSFWFIFGYSSVIRSSHFVTLVLVSRSWIIIVFLVRTVFDYFCCYCGLQILRSLIFAETGSRSQKQRRPSPALLRRQFRGHRAKLGGVASHSCWWWQWWWLTTWWTRTRLPPCCQTWSAVPWSESFSHLHEEGCSSICFSSQYCSYI